MSLGPWNLWSVYWLVVWFGIGFLGPELFALFTGHDENTLSFQVWRLSGLGQSGGWTFAHFFIAAGMVWLLFHFVFGWFR
jgi:hypothetical protein